VKIQQIRELDLAELAKLEARLKEDLFNLRVQTVTGQLENVKKPWGVKREIARVKTVIQEKRRAAASSDALSER
jgi:large subunit ribosomal protein L29